MSGFVAMVDKVYRRISNGTGRYFVYISPRGFLVCVHLRPIRDRAAIARYNLELLGVYTPGVTRSEFMADVCYSWPAKRKT